MNKALLFAAATALAFSGSVFAKGGARTGASADAYVDRNVQISANDCQMLSVESARNACMQQAQSGSGTDANVGGTSGSGMQGNVGASSGRGMHGDTGASSGSSMRHGSGGQAMPRGSGAGGSSDSGARGPMHQGR